MKDLRDILSLVICWLVACVIRTDSQYVPYDTVFVAGPGDIGVRDVLIDSQNNTYMFGPNTVLCYAKYSSKMELIWSRSASIAINSACFSPNEESIYAAGSYLGAATIFQINSQDGSIIKIFQRPSGELRKVTLCGDGYLCIGGFQQTTNYPWVMKIRTNNMELVWEQFFISWTFASLEFHASSNKLFVAGTHTANFEVSFYLAELNVTNGIVVSDAVWGKSNCSNSWGKSNCSNSWIPTLKDTAITEDGILYVATSNAVTNSTGTVCSASQVLVTGKISIAELSQHLWIQNVEEFSASSVDAADDGRIYVLADRASDNQWNMLTYLSSTGQLLNTTSPVTSTNQISAAIRARTQQGRICVGFNQYTTVSGATDWDASLTCLVTWLPPPSSLPPVQYNYYATVTSIPYNSTISDSNNNTYIFGDAPMNSAKYSPDMQLVWKNSSYVNFVSACFSADESAIFAVGFVQFTDSANSQYTDAHVVQIDPRDGSIVQSYTNYEYSGKWLDITLCGSGYVCIGGNTITGYAWFLRLHTNNLQYQPLTDFNLVYSYSNWYFESIEYFPGTSQLYLAGGSAKEFYITQVFGAPPKELIWPGANCYGGYAAHIVDTAATEDGIIYVGTSTAVVTNLTFATCTSHKVLVAGKLSPGLQQIWIYNIDFLVPTSVDVGDDGLIYILADNSTDTTFTTLRITLNASTGNFNNMTYLVPSSKQQVSTSIRTRTQQGRMAISYNQYYDSKSDGFMNTYVTFTPSPSATPSITPSVTPSCSVTPSPSQTPSSQIPSSSSLPAGNSNTSGTAIGIGIAVSVVIAGIIGGAVFLYLKKKKNGQQQKDEQEQQLTLIE